MIDRDTPSGQLHHDESASGDEPQRPGDATLQLRLRPNQVIAGKYRVISLLGQGGMGSVYRVENVEDKHEYALKTLNDPTVSAVSWLRFQKEAKAVEMLDHAAIVKIHDFGLVDDRQPFFVMDLFHGETLSHVIKTSGPMPLEKALDVFIEVCLGLGYAHTQGVVHRDIKSSNIMIAQPEKQSQAPVRVKIVDFGIAKVMTTKEAESLNLTRTGEVFGTPFYMSPEQCLGLALDQRADIYSLGCVMFEALTGFPPFMGETALSTMMKHQTEKPPTLREASLGKEFPQAMENVMSRMLEKDPRARYQNLLEVVSDLKSIKAGHVSGAHIAGSGLFARPSEVENKKPDYLRIAAVAAAVTIASGVSYYAGIMSAPRPTKTETPSVYVDNSADLALRVINPEKTHTETTFFSVRTPDNPETRYFHFPTDMTMGRLSARDPNTKLYSYDGEKLTQQKLCVARGDVIVENFTPLELKVDADVDVQAKQLDRFRRDELYSCDFEKHYLIEDDALKAIAGRPDLRILDITECTNLTNKVIKTIDSLPHLDELYLPFTKIDGSGLASMHRLKELTGLAVKTLPQSSKMLEALKGSDRIKKLDMRLTDITDSDMTLIATLKNLEELNISGNGKITYKGLRQLASLHRLGSLIAYNIPVTPEQFANVLPRIPNLGGVSCGDDKWSGPDFKLVTKAVPRCQVVGPPEHQTIKVQDVMKKMEGF
jgi:tRNA A-37 threonylcarbamoyl transferase component Bud32